MEKIKAIDRRTARKFARQMKRASMMQPITQPQAITRAGR